jgi:hypothetical protein
MGAQGQDGEAMVATTDAEPGDADMPAGSQERTLSAHQLEAVVRMLPAVDSVELKATVAHAERRMAVARLGIDPMKAQLRQVSFFDTPDLQLFDRGVVVRLRRIQGGSGDAVVKLRPVAPGVIETDLREAEGFGVEIDAMPGGFVCSARLRAEVSDKVLRHVTRRGAPLRRALTRAQREFYADNAPAGVDLDDLVMLGPVTVLKARFTPDGSTRRMVAELWLYPDAPQILELSVKAAPEEALDVAAQTRAVLAAHDVDLDAPQQAKTRTALEYFASLVDPAL